MNQQLSDIKKLIQFLKALKKDKEALERNLKEVTEQIEHYATDVIPTYIQSLGLSEIKLDTGETISLATKYFASISEERAPLAFKWMKEHDYGDLVKYEYRLNYGRSELEAVERQMLTNFLIEHDMEFIEKESVHAQTLKKFVKENVEAGTPEFPFKLFAATVVKEVQVGK